MDHTISQRALTTPATDATHPAPGTDAVPHDVPSPRATPETAGFRSGLGSRWGRAGGVSGIATVAVTLLAILFLWPVRVAAPADLPLVVTGPSQAQQLMQTRLAQTDAPFQTTSVADRAAAVRAIRERSAYGGIVITPGTGAGVDVEILTASAASPAVAQALTQASTQLTAAPAAGVTARVHSTDVVPLATTDARGAGIGTLALPLGIGGLVVGVLVARWVRGRTMTVAALLAAAALAVLAWALVLNPWFGLLTGSFWAEWALATLAVAATAAFVAGAHALAGVPGIALAALVTTPFGFLIAGTQLPREFLPAPWGDVGQGLIPGASATAFRLESYFPDASLGSPLTVLTVWLVVGLACVGLRRARPLSPRPA